MKTPLANFIDALEAHNRDALLKANCPTTSHADSHDLLCHVGGVDFAIRLGKEFLADEERSEVADLISDSNTEIR